MAKLSSDLLTLEIRFRSFEDRWVVYDILWLWDGTPILNDAILKRHNPYWAARQPGGIHANEHRADFFISTIEGVLANGEAAYTETTDPDVLLAIYPGSPFPFLPSHYRLVYESEETIQRREARERLKAEIGHLPDDRFTLLLFVDTYNFRDCFAYSGDGLTLHMNVTRAELEKFCADLRTEYFAFKRQHPVDQASIEDLGEEDARKLPLFGPEPGNTAQEGTTHPGKLQSPEAP